MATQRFPKSKYRRQLDEMRRDLQDWKGRYIEAVIDEQTEWLQARFLERITLLEDLRRQLASCIEALDTLPRLA